MHNFVSNFLSTIALFSARRNVWKHNPSSGVGSCFAHSVHKHSCEFIQCVHGSSMHVCACVCVCVCVFLFDGFGHIVFVQDGISYWPLESHCPPMPVVQVTIHPRGLHPLQAAHAFHLHEQEGIPLREIWDEVTNMKGESPSAKAVWHAVRMVKASQSSDSIGRTKYANCGWKRRCMLCSNDAQPKRQHFLMKS